MKTRGIFKLQLRCALRSKTWRYALMISLLITCVSFVQTCLNFWGHDVAELPSAAVAWAGNHGYMKTSLFGMWLTMLMFPLTSAAFGDALYLNRKQKMVPIIASRTSYKSYIASTAVVAFLMASCLALLVLIVSQLLAFTAFPLTSGQDAFVLSFNAPASDEHLWGDWSDALLLSELYFSNRYLYNFVLMCYDSFWSGLMAVASFALSCYVSRSRVAVLGAPTLLFLTLSNFIPFDINVASYVSFAITWSSGGSLTFFVLSPLIFAVALLVALVCPVVLKWDVLL